MDGKEAIIEKIITEATQKAELLVSEANAYYNQKMSEAEEWGKTHIMEESAKADRDAIAIIERRKIVASIEGKKILLAKKRQLINTVFDNVYKSLCSMNKRDYLALVEKLLETYADEGDKVLLSTDGVIGIADVERLKVFIEKKLKIIDKRSTFIGGVKLVGEKCDKDISFKALVDSIKEENESVVSKMLFKNNDKH